MYPSTLIPALRRTVLALALGAAAGLASAQAMHVELDTGALSGAGWLDLQFNPASVPAVPAGAVLSHLVGFERPTMTVLTGDVRAAAPGTYVFGNGSDWNDVFHAVRLGGRIGFDVRFGGQADPSPAAIPSMFALALYGADGLSQLGRPDANGSLLTLSWTPTADGAGLVVATVSDPVIATVGVVPEPSVWLMLAAGLAALAGVGRAKKKPRA